MKRVPHFVQEQMNPYRRPEWRWNRAVKIIDSGKYLSRKMDDKATGIAVSYFRELGRCLTERRLRSVQERFRHVVGAETIWGLRDQWRLELEMRLLSRMNDVEIGLAMGIPAETCQAYRDLFFDVSDRIDSTSFIQWQVIRLLPQESPTPTAMALMSSYIHGPAVIEKWLRYLQNDVQEHDLSSEEGRQAASFELLLAVYSLQDTPETKHRMLCLLPSFIENGPNFTLPRTVKASFERTTSKIVDEIPLTSSDLPPFSYDPNRKKSVSVVKNVESRDSRKRRLPGKDLPSPSIRPRMCETERSTIDGTRKSHEFQ